MTFSVPGAIFNAHPLASPLSSILCIFTGSYFNTMIVLPKILSSALFSFPPSLFCLLGNFIHSNSFFSHSCGTILSGPSEPDIPPRSEVAFLTVRTFLVCASVTVQHFSSGHPSQMLGTLKKSPSFTRKGYCVPSVF